MALLKQISIWAVVLFLFSCKTVKKAEEKEQRQTRTEIEQISVLKDSVKLTTEVQSSSISVKYSRPDSTGLQYVEEVVFTGVERKSIAEKTEQLETIQKTVKKELKTAEKKTVEKQESRPFSNFGSVAALILCILVCAIVLRIVLVKKR